MRVFLILLLFANLGYFAWWQGWIVERPDPALASGPDTFQPAPQNLILLSELSPERLALMDSLARARTARTDAQAELQQLQGEIAAVAGEISENQQQLAQDQARSAEVQQELLETLDAAVATQGQAEAPALAVAPAPVAATPWCARAGSFADRPAAEAFVASLQGLGATGTIEVQEQPVSSTWWVHMPAFPTEAEAMARLQELQAKNIDSYYMRTGEMAGGISLGVYSREESARIAQQQLTDRGYATSVREVFRMGERFYVRIVLPDAGLREAPEWTDFLARGGGLEVLENACETIAPGNEFP